MIELLCATGSRVQMPFWAAEIALNLNVQQERWQRIDQQTKRALAQSTSGSIYDSLNNLGELRDLDQIYIPLLFLNFSLVQIRAAR